MADDTVIRIVTQDEATAGLSKITDEIKKLADASGAPAAGADVTSAAFSKLGTVIAGLGIAAIVYKMVDAVRDFATESVQAAAAEEQAFARLASAVNASGTNYSSVSSITEEMAAKFRALGIDCNETASALTQLTTITGSYKKALEYLPAIADMAASKGMALSSAAMVVGRAMEGNVGILRRYGVMLAENATAEDAMAAIQQKFAGTAQAMADTTAGRLQVLAVAWDDLKEAVGTPLLSAVGNVATAMTRFVANLTTAASEGGAFHGSLVALGDTINSFVPILQAIGNTIINDALPALAKFAADGVMAFQGFVDAAGRTVAFLRDNLIPVITALATAITTTAIPVITAFGAAIQASMIASIGSAITAIHAFLAVYGALITAIAAIAAAAIVTTAIIGGFVYALVKLADEAKKNADMMATQEAYIAATSGSYEEYKSRMEGAASAQGKLTGMQQTAYGVTISVSQVAMRGAEAWQVYHDSVNDTGIALAGLEPATLKAESAAMRLARAGIDTGKAITGGLAETSKEAMDTLNKTVSEGQANAIKIAQSYAKDMAQAASNQQLADIRAQAEYNATRAGLVAAGKDKEVAALDRAYAKEKTMRDLDAKIAKVQAEAKYKAEIDEQTKAFWTKMSLWIAEGIANKTINEGAGKEMLAAIKDSTGAQVTAYADASLAVIDMALNTADGVGGAAKSIYANTKTIVENYRKLFTPGAEPEQPVDWEKYRKEIEQAYNNVAGAFDSGTSDVKASAQSATREMASVISDIQKGIEDAIKAFQDASGIRIPENWRKGVQEIGRGIEIAVQEFYAVFGRTKTMLEGASKIAQTASQVSTALSDAAQAFTLVKAQKDWTVSAQQITALVAQVRAAIEAFVTGITQVSEDEQGRLSSVTKAITSISDTVTAVKGILDMLAERIPPMRASLGDVLNALGSISNQLVLWMQSPGTEDRPTRAADVGFGVGLLEGFRPLLESWVKALGPLRDLLDLAKSLFEVTSLELQDTTTRLNDFMDWVGLLGAALITWMNKPGTGDRATKFEDVQFGVPILESYMEWLKDWAAALAPLLDLVNFANNMSSALATGLRAFNEGALDDVFNYLGDVMFAVHAFYGELFTRIAKGEHDPQTDLLMSGLSEFYKNWLATLSDSADAIGNFVSKVNSIFSGLATRIPTISPTAFADLATALGDVMVQAHEFYGYLFTAIAKGERTPEIDLLMSGLSEIYTDWLKVLTATAGPIGDFVSKVNSVVSGLTAKVPKISSTAFSNLATALGDVMLQVHAFYSQLQIAAKNGAPAPEQDLLMNGLAETYTDWLKILTESAGPIGDAVSKIVSVITALSAKAPKISSTAFGGLATTLGDIMLQIHTFYSQLEIALANNALTPQQSLLMGGLNETITNWLDNLAEGAGAIGDAVSKTANALTALSAKVPKISNTAFADFMTALGNMMAQAHTAYTTAMVNAAKGDKLLWTGLSEAIIEWLKTLSNSAGAIGDVVGKTTTALTALATKIPEISDTAFPNLIAALGDLMQQAHTAYASAMMQAAKGNELLWDGLSDNIIAWLKRLSESAGAIGDVISKTNSALTALSSKIPKAIITFSDVMMALGRLFQGVIDYYSNLMETPAHPDGDILLRAGGLGEEINKWLGNLAASAGAVGEALSRTLSAFSSLTKEIPEATITVGSIFGALGGLFQDVLDYYNDLLQMPAQPGGGNILKGGGLSEELIAWLTSIQQGIEPIAGILTATISALTSLGTTTKPYNAVKFTQLLESMRDAIGRVMAAFEGTELDTTRLTAIQTSAEAVRGVLNALDGMAKMIKDINVPDVGKLQQLAKALGGGTYQGVNYAGLIPTLASIPVLPASAKTSLENASGAMTAVKRILTDLWSLSGTDPAEIDLLMTSTMRVISKVITGLQNTLTTVDPSLVTLENAAKTFGTRMVNILNNIISFWQLEGAPANVSTIMGEFIKAIANMVDNIEASLLGLVTWLGPDGDFIKSLSAIDLTTSGEDTMGTLKTGMLNSLDSGIRDVVGRFTGTGAGSFRGALAAVSLYSEGWGIGRSLIDGISAGANSRTVTVTVYANLQAT
jgi:hypothetical protein